MGDHGRRWPRVVAWLSMLVVAGVLVTAGGTYVWLNHMVGQSKNTERSSEISDFIDRQEANRKGYGDGGGEASYEDPPGMDILLMGSDNREGEEEYGRSDTLMLVHVDPDSKYASVLSLPRDLRVRIPGHGTQKLNAAYALGGPQLAIETVTDLTGILPDHYANIDFDSFREVTTELGGIYVDVDRRYYNDSEAYEWINLRPGYQKLWGEEALDWVRFRHDTNADFGRIERQQRFLKAVKEQAFRWDTAMKLPEMVRLLFQNIETSMGTNDILKLAYWGIRLGPDRIQQVTLDAVTDEIGGASYVIATDAAVREAVEDLVEPPEPEPAVATEEGSSGAEPSGEAPAGEGPSGDQTSAGDSEGDGGTTTTSGDVDLTGITVNVLNGNGRPGEANAGAKFLRSLGATINRVGDAAQFDFVDSVVRYPADKAGAAAQVARALGTDQLVVDDANVISAVLGSEFEASDDFRQAPTLPSIPNAGEWKTLAGETSFELMAPSILPEHYTWKDHRVYDIQADEGPRAALKVYYKLKGEDQYLGIMETTFTNAPAASPGAEVEHEGLVLTVVDYEGKVDRVWWEKDGVLYWVSNTLSYRLDRDEMLAVAKSMTTLQ